LRVRAFHVTDSAIDDLVARFAPTRAHPRTAETEGRQS
jgi:S-DNA-T family DNA segregation ATPase FtsK/SpoIIIE